ncbi:nucleotidyl transferase AbiEii/AbiGii toxin family protein [Gordonibacter urolithinfaciens]|nr:nucleotidyl transferase AbiEii/AbiGii toxin family protein [Gordonibacter urolithinfaciens]
MAVLNPSACFKGGTSLSKSHRIINRFSEDVDLGMEKEHPTGGPAQEDEVFRMRRRGGSRP